MALVRSSRDTFLSVTWRVLSEVVFLGGVSPCWREELLGREVLLLILFLPASGCITFPSHGTLNTNRSSYKGTSCLWMEL